MKKFATPLAIQGTPKQIEELIPKLCALGYTDEFLRNQKDVSMPCLKHSRTVVDASNPELVLALAAMVEGDEIHVGEWVISVTDSGPLLPLGMYKVSEVSNEFINVYGIKATERWATNTYYVRKATVEEIMNHFSVNQSDQKPDKEEREPIGYKVVSNLLRWNYGTMLYKNDYGQWCEKDANPGDVCVGDDVLINNTALFEPVYAEPKPKFKTMVLEAEDSKFEVTIKDGYVVYGTEQILVFDLERWFEAVSNYSRVIGIWQFKISHVDIGCKKGISLKDLETLIAASHELLRK